MNFDKGIQNNPKMAQLGFNSYSLVLRGFKIFMYKKVVLTLITQYNLPMKGIQLDPYCCMWLRNGVLDNP